MAKMKGVPGFIVEETEREGEHIRSPRKRGRSSRKVGFFCWKLGRQERQKRCLVIISVGSRVGVEGEKRTLDKRGGRDWFTLGKAEKKFC